MSQTIISDSYAPFGTRLDGLPEKPEPPREDPKSDHLFNPELLKILHCSADSLDYFTRWGLPA